jgi:hypothetical protein
VLLTPSLTVCTYSRESFLTSSRYRPREEYFFVCVLEYVYSTRPFFTPHIYWFKKKTRYTRCQANRLAALFFFPLFSRPSTGAPSTHTRNLSAFPLVNKQTGARDVTRELGGGHCSVVVVHCRCRLNESSSLCTLGEKRSRGSNVHRCSPSNRWIDSVHIRSSHQNRCQAREEDTKRKSRRNILGEILAYPHTDDPSRSLL